MQDWTRRTARDTLLSFSKLVFTHGDLQPSNIILDISSNRCNVSLTDWAYSAWMPIYWDAFDACDILEEERLEGWLKVVAESIGSYPNQTQVLYDIRRLGFVH